MNHGFRTLHPVVLLTYYLATTIAITINRHPFFLFFTVLVLILFNWVCDRGKTMKWWWRFFVLFGLLLFLLNPLLNHRGQHVLIYLFDQPITMEAVVQGAINALTFVALLLLFITFPRIIDSSKFLFLFSGVFPKWGLLAMLSVRFVPLFRIRLEEIIAVQRARGISLTTGTVRARLKNGFALVHSLLTWSLEDGIQTADSMAARGYGLKQRSRYNPYRLHPSDIFAIGTIAGLLALTIFGSWLGDGVLTMTPVIEPVYLTGREWTFFIIHTLLVGFPVIVEIKEEAQWFYWKQKN